MARELLRATPTLEGRTLHGGARASLRVAPAPRGEGVCFIRADLGGARVRARLEAALESPRRTVLVDEGVRVSTVEHVLAALHGLAIGDAVVQLTAEEPPILDGSAAPLARALLAASTPAPERAGRWQVMRSTLLRRGSSACQLRPDERLVIDCRIDFAHPAIGRQRLLCSPGPDAFLVRLAPARTFGFLDDASQLRGAALARGASLGCALVYGPRGVLNPEGTRFRDEPVRHKILDALGDLALLGAPLIGRVKLERCSHGLLLATLRRAQLEGALRWRE